MLDRGATTKEILASSHSKATLSRVRDALEKERKQAEKQAEEERKQKTQQFPSSQHDTIVKPRSLEPIVVGGLIIEPADWRINQYGGFLIMSTYEWARQKYGYEGTVGEFLCDTVQVMRRIMGLDIMPFQYLTKEGDNGATGEEANQGGDVSAESRERPGGEPEPAEVT